MDARVKKLWVDALRSGEYKQADSRLRGESGYCCLGVLCDIHAQETGGHWDGEETNHTYDGCATYLPKSVVAWADLRNDDPDVTPNNKASQLSRLNDTQVPFAEIADAIEASL